MNEPASDYARDMALFRYGVIAELLRLPPGSPERAKAQAAYEIPGSRRTRIAAQTLRDWLRLYTRGGFDALHPQPRADRGRTRRLAAPVAELLTALKEGHPEWAVRTLIRHARASGQLPPDTHLAPATVYRLLKRAGLLDRPGEPAAAKDRLRFAFRDAGELWMSDVLHGPQVRIDPKDACCRRKTYRTALLDDATRVIPHAAFAFAETAESFLPVCKQAVLRRGLPQRLYVDNGANYRSQQLAVICASRNVHLVHARPYQPAGKGKIERFFRTVRAQFLPTLGSEGTRSLAALNARWGAWVEGEYHQTPHRGLDGRTPLDQWALAAENLRRADPDLDLDRLFVFRYERRVNKDRTVRLRNRLYEVDAALVGEKVVLLQDPALPPERPLEVLHGGRAAGRATLLDTYANTRVQRAGGRALAPQRLGGPGGGLLYLQHFALAHYPFETPAHSDELFASQAAREPAARLAHLLELHGIGLLTGEPGCGKTSVCRQVVDRLHPGRYKVCYVTPSTGSVCDTFQAIGWELGLAPQRTRAGAFRALQTEITRLAGEARQPPVLVLDEAQHLRNEVLEDWRLLTNFDMDSAPRLCLLLVGLTELQRRLTMAVHASLNQRIVVRQHLGGLARGELADYLGQRLRRAGCELPLLEPAALEALHLAARGLPRQVNRLAHYALAAAALDQARTVSAAPVERACAELQL